MNIRQVTQFNRVVDIEALSNYLLSRRNMDGGFCFYGLDESSLNDTFYAVLILDIINKLPEDKKTVEYIASFQMKKLGFTSIYSAWMALKSLKILNESRLNGLDNLVIKLYKSHRIHERVYVESASVFESSYYLADMLSMIGRHGDCGSIADAVLKYRLKDSNFGTIEPTMASTFYALSILHLAGRPMDEYKDAAKFLNACAVGSGGFSKKPDMGLAFMDEIYYAVLSLRLLGLRPALEKKTADFISGCQNENGGFRRALASGISGFDTSYYAMEALRALLNV
jgi:hypothetical protein